MKSNYGQYTELSTKEPAPVLHSSSKESDRIKLDIEAFIEAGGKIETIDGSASTINAIDGKGFYKEGFDISKKKGRGRGISIK